MGTSIESITTEPSREKDSSLGQEMGKNRRTTETASGMDGGRPGRQPPTRVTRLVPGPSESWIGDRSIASAATATATMATATTAAVSTAPTAAPPPPP